MRKLLNTLYVTTPERYLALDGENVLVLEEKEILIRLPLHNLEGIVTFGYTGASPALMGACAKRGISLSFMNQNGQFLASVSGENRGNVILRKQQYRISDSLEDSIPIARNMIIGKIYNSKWVLERATRDHALQVDVDALKKVTANLDEHIRQLLECDSMDSIRGIEGNAASQYFSVFDQLILQNKEEFFFENRNRRPPLDNVNAMLSFAYTLLANECAAALTAVGLDAYVGFLHTDRPGRTSLALDLMEELRAVYADRFVLTLINKKTIKPEHFVKKENGAVLMNDTGRKIMISAWQGRKRDKIKHPFLGDKIEWGLIPHVQALLLARLIRGDLDEYPVFLWKEERREMLVLITYDVNTETASGKKRLRKVAKECQNYGQRVQNSVFECIMDNAKTKVVKAKLLEIIDMDKDSLRFYYLGNAYKNKVEHYGTKQSIDLEGTLII